MPEAAPVINTGLPVMSLRFLAICTPYRGGCAVRVPPVGIIRSGAASAMPPCMKRGEMGHPAVSLCSFAPSD